MSGSAEPPGGGAGPKSLDAALLRVRDGRGTAVGVGFLVSPGIALTCAHVVSAALGTPYDVPPPAGARIPLDAPLLPGAGSQSQVYASVESWVPPGGAGGATAGDVAVLRLTAPVPGARPLRMVQEQEVWGHPVRAFGFPAGRPDGVWHEAALLHRQGAGWIQANMTGKGYAVSRGFSGSPVWDDTLAGVVGMLVQAEAGEPAVSYLIPTEGLLQAWPGLAELTLAPSPFRSLTAFQEADAAVFHGRAAESASLADALGAQRWLTVVGPSGSGKSSLALAGIVPRRRAAGDAVAVLRPSLNKNPLTALAAALLPLLEPGLSESDRLLRLPGTAAHLAAGGLADVAAGLPEVRSGRARLLIVVDQFEELLALDATAADQLTAVLYDEDLPPTVRVLTTLRADFLEAALDRPRLGRTLGGGLHYLTPLGRDRLREVVTAPVEPVPGVAYEHGLVERILDDAGSGPGALPLLGFTLDRLWQQQNGGLLTHRAYDALGGVSGALSAYADQAWDAYVPDRDDKAARRLLTRLVRIPIGSAAATRRTVSRAELGADEWAFAQALAGTRLLVTDTDAEGTETVELAHEALITAWDRLADLTHANVAFLAWRETLRHEVRRWQDGGRAAALLPSAPTLAAARPWLEEHGGELTEAERAYLARGRTHLRLRRGLRSAAAAVAVLALVLGGLYAYASDQARQRQAYADSRALAQAAQDQAAADPARAAMLAMAAFRTAPTEEARNQLLRAYLAHSHADRLLSALPGPIGQFDSSRDGQVVLARSTSGRAVLFTHAASGTVRSELLAAKQVVTAVVAPDGTRAAFVSEDGGGGWFEVRPDADRIAGPVHPLPRISEGLVFGDPGRGVALSGDGRRLVRTTKSGLVWWDLDKDAMGGSVALPAETDGSVWFAPDHRTLLAGLWRGAGVEDGFRLMAFDPSAGPPREVVGQASAFLPSGDGSVAVVCRKEGDDAVYFRVRVADAGAEGEAFRTRGVCAARAVDASGRRAVLGDTRELQLLDLERREVVARTDAPRQSSSNSARLVAAGEGLRVVTMARDSSWIAYTAIWPAPATLSVGLQQLTKDGDRTISRLADGSALQLRPVLPDDDRLLAEVRRPQPYWKPEHSQRMPLSRDGKLLADRDATNSVTVYEVDTLRPVTRVTTAAVSGEDRFLCWFHGDGTLVTSADTVVQQWDPRSGQELARFDAAAEGATAFPYPADHQVAVLVPGDPEVKVVDLTTGRTVEKVPVPEDTYGVQFESSGRSFAVMRSGGIIEVWNRQPLRKELGPLPSIGDSARAQYVASFLGDGGRFVVAAASTVRTYRVGARNYVDAYDFGRAEDRFGGSARYQFMDMSADGRTVVHIAPSGSGGPLRLDPALWRRELCRIIGGREFTDEERRSLPVRIPDRQVCA
ncbi:nSTAND1 domain-containing NTPase [Streptomyces antimicrobicus]|uniref:Trypsin-like peptidase domain-containing protein n=1 Tax=Streptomyces antimicrobicus TaxID=2883108 RepID=A0ABS8B4Q7_9ACTN|nr:trypsin-like peptidase domain-containing protein [Streptomyces antimicrobicus]MCB5179591.1 trypsin-like peptidase domain-containing protein [Streptomyces antimicrobicus]